MANSWNGDFNPRGASLTFTNTNGKAFMYYFCLMDFPSSFTPYNGIVFSYSNVSQIEYPGGMDYDPSKQYLASDHTLVYYQNMYYYCLQDTTGTFDASCWQSAGSQSFQLNFTWMDYGNGWPGSSPGDTTYTLSLPLFTTDPNYNPDLGPIVKVSVTCSGSSVAKTGNPNSKRPPIINLPLRGSNGGETGTPVYAIFTSLTSESTGDFFTVVCVNSGGPGFKNHLGAIQPGSYGIWNGFLLPGGPPNPVAAIGLFQYNSSLSPIEGITLNNVNPPVFPFPNPVSSNPYYYSI